MKDTFLGRFSSLIQKSCFEAVLQFKRNQNKNTILGGFQFYFKKVVLELFFEFNNIHKKTRFFCRFLNFKKLKKQVSGLFSKQNRFGAIFRLKRYRKKRVLSRF